MNNVTHWGDIFCCGDILLGVAVKEPKTFRGTEYDNFSADLWAILALRKLQSLPTNDAFWNHRFQQDIRQLSGNVKEWDGRLLVEGTEGG